MIHYTIYGFKFQIRSFTLKYDLLCHINILWYNVQPWKVFPCSKSGEQCCWVYSSCSNLSRDSAVFFLTQGRVPSGLRGNSTVLCIVINYMIQSGESLPQAVFSKYGHLNYTAQEWCYSWRIFMAVNFYDFFFPKCMKVCVCVCICFMREGIFAKWNHFWTTLPSLIGQFTAQFESRRVLWRVRVMIKGLGMKTVSGSS